MQLLVLTSEHQVGEHYPTFPLIRLSLLQCSHVGVWKNDHVEIIANEHGNYATPCYVSMVANECLVGEQAKRQAYSYPHNT